jgi:hypothetical protein
MPQIQIGKQPVTQITIIEAEPEKQAEALAIMTERARLMARQPGFISNQPASQSRWAPHRELHSMGNPRPAAGRGRLEPLVHANEAAPIQCDFSLVHADPGGVRDPSNRN